MASREITTIDDIQAITENTEVMVQDGAMMGKAPLKDLLGKLVSEDADGNIVLTYTV